MLPAGEVTSARGSGACPLVQSYFGHTKEQVLLPAAEFALEFGKIV
jgi:hypothetical protein